MLYQLLKCLIYYEIVCRYRKTIDMNSVYDLEKLISNCSVANSETFALHPQHETSCDSEIQTKKDFTSKFRKQLGSSPTTPLNSEGKEETLECLKP